MKKLLAALILLPLFGGCAVPQDLQQKIGHIADSLQKPGSLPQPSNVPGTPVSQTALAGVFDKNVWNGSKDPYYPRVAVTVRDWFSSTKCWVFDAVIWTSPTERSVVTGATECYKASEAPFHYTEVANALAFKSQPSSVHHTGNRRTDGPNPPMSAWDGSEPAYQAKGDDLNLNEFLGQLVADTSWQTGPAETTIWLVGFIKSPVGAQASTKP